jgi:hypothetical protein
MLTQVDQAGVVLRENVQIAFTHATLNGLDVSASDIRNAYLQAPSSQKDYIICGPKFRIENIGKATLIIDIQGTIWKKGCRKGFQEFTPHVCDTSTLSYVPPIPMCG